MWPKQVALLLILLMCLTATAEAQNAVQLPTYSYFGVDTTVSVPDRGSAYLGGINRAADGRSEFGVPMLPFRPFRNQGIGSQRSSSSVWASVYIHDFEAMDEYLLNQGRGSASRSSSRPIVASRYEPRSQSAFRAEGAVAAPRSWEDRRRPQPATGPLTKTVAQLQAERAGQQQARLAEAERLFERGKNAQAAGKMNVAKIYYQQASRRSDGPLRDQIVAQLDLINAAGVAQRKP